jgi:DNA-binding XRE family transcriptional regulator
MVSESRKNSESDIELAEHRTHVVRTSRPYDSQSDPQPTLGAAIRQLREKRELSQEDVAEKAGLSGRTLSALEAGNANPTWATAPDLAAALGVSSGELAKLSEKHD